MDMTKIFNDLIYATMKSNNWGEVERLIKSGKLILDPRDLPSHKKFYFKQKISLWFNQMKNINWAENLFLGVLHSKIKSSILKRYFWLPNKPWA